MKIRHGYVSNSSSTSFCIVGFLISNNNGDFERLFSDFDDDFFGYLDEKFGRNLEVRHGVGEYCEDDYIVGKSVKSMKDNQTLIEFKTEVLEELKRDGLNDIGIDDIQIYVDGGYC